MTVFFMLRGGELIISVVPSLLAVLLGLYYYCAQFCLQRRYNMLLAQQILNSEIFQYPRAGAGQQLK